MSTNANIEQFQDNLHLISLPVPIPGFERFIGAWLYSGSPMVLVDVGPTVSVPYLLSAIAELGFGAPELILLTHIHIDHAGGIGLIAEAFPQAEVFCHPKGLPHLVDPDRLWQGSLQTLGETAKAYQPIASLAARQAFDTRHLERTPIRCLDTPGHAAHHVSYLIGDLLFAGEAAGVCLDLPDHSLYMRPATPPRFFFDTSLNSIELLIAEAPQKICYGHVGLRENAVDLLQLHHQQLRDWLDWIQPVVKRKDDIGKSLEVCAETLLAKDRRLNGYAELHSDVRQREWRFLINSIKGYWHYLENP